MSPEEKETAEQQPPAAPEEKAAEPATPPAAEVGAQRESADAAVAQAPAAAVGEGGTAAAAAPRAQEAGAGARPERPRPATGERRRRFGRRKVCSFCVEKVRVIDYKDPTKLRRYLSDRGRIEARRKTGTCAKHQRWLALALKRARHLALLPYTPEHIRASGMFVGRR